MKSQSVGADAGLANFRPNDRASASRAGSMSMRVTSAPSICAQRNPASAPTTPAPTTAIRLDGPGAPPQAASQVALSAVSTLAASAARGSGTSAGNGTTASTDRSNLV